MKFYEKLKKNSKTTY